ncbi:MAG: alpha/beta hydrolase [Syntrophaceae bacterium]|nr:alpha/beta hydrolase [Syntrophaceae bacterium]
MKRFLFLPWVLSVIGLLGLTHSAFGQGASGYLSIPSKRISLSGVNVHFVEAGKGPPLLFLHGLGGSWKDWSANLPAFAATHRVMALDFPGFGDSDKPEVEYSIEWLTDVVEKFIQEQKIDPVNLVAHSMGGLVALNLASRPNSRVKKLIVADAVGIGDKSEFLGYAMSKKIMGPETRWENVEAFLKNEFRAMADDFIKQQKPQTAREFFESLKMPLTGKPLVPMTPSVQMTADIIDFDIRPKLGSIRQPTLILWGAKDPVVPPQDASFLHKEVRSSTLVLFPNSGHSPMIEHPSLFNQELDKFLRAGK